MRLMNMKVKKGRCPEQDLNLHVLRHTPLKRACLPISPPGQEGQRYAYFLNLDAPN